MLNETHRALPRYKLSDFFSSLLGRVRSLKLHDFPIGFVKYPLTTRM